MRLPLVAPSDLSAEQRPLYEDMRAGIEANFRGFKTKLVACVAPHQA
jgi:4-carboxymuconolactone decarboxylase